MTHTFTHNTGLAVHFDSAEIVPDNPGDGTPLMVTKGKYSATYNCALGTGELDGGRDGYYQLTDSEYRWLELLEEALEELLEAYTPLAPSATGR